MVMLVSDKSRFQSKLQREHYINMKGSEHRDNIATKLWRLRCMKHGNICSNFPRSDRLTSLILSQYLPQRNENFCSHTCTKLYISIYSSFIPKLEIITFFNDWNKLWYIHVMEHYSTIKKDELLIHVTTWIVFRGTIMNEDNLRRLYVYCMISFI